MGTQMIFSIQKSTSNTDKGLKGMKTTGLLKPATMVLLAGMLLVAGQVQAQGSVEKGSEKARSCQVCHGKGGKSTKEAYPILAGQHAAYIRKQLHAFRDGTRKDPIMNGMAAPLSDQDIEDLGAYFNSVN